MPADLAAIEDAVPALVEARTLVAEFHTMPRYKDVSGLEPWLARARSSLIALFARGVLNDEGAVSAAISSSWSNGQTEDQITKLKLERVASNLIHSFCRLARRSTRKVAKVDAGHRPSGLTPWAPAKRQTRRAGPIWAKSVGLRLGRATSRPSPKPSTLA